MDNTEVLPINVFKHSFGPILELLNNSDVKYQMRQMRAGAVMMSSEVIEIIVNASMWVSLASIIIAFIKAKNGREVTVQTKDNRIIHAKGLDSKQLQEVLKEACSITAIDTGKE